MAVKRTPIRFIAALAEGRACLTFDRDGGAQLKLDVSRQEAAKIAERLDELMSVSFRVVLSAPEGE